MACWGFPDRHGRWYESLWRQACIRLYKAQIKALQYTDQRWSTPVPGVLWHCSFLDVCAANWLLHILHQDRKILAYTPTKDPGLGRHSAHWHDIDMFLFMKSWSPWDPWHSKKCLSHCTRQGVVSAVSRLVYLILLSSDFSHLKVRKKSWNIARHCKTLRSGWKKHLIIGHEYVISLQCYCMRLRDLDSHGQICWFYAGDFLSFSSVALQRMHRCSCFS